MREHGVEPVAALLAVAGSEFAQKALALVLPQPIGRDGKRRDDLVFLAALAARAGPVGVEILMEFENVGALVVDRAHRLAVDAVLAILRPAVCAGPVDAGHEQQVAGARRAYRVDRGLRRFRPGCGGHIVRFVHETEDDVALTAEFMRQSAPEIGEGAIGNDVGADRTAAPAAVIVDVENDRQFLRPCARDALFEKREMRGVEILFEHGLQALPEEGKAHDRKALFLRPREFGFGREMKILVGLAWRRAEFRAGEIDARRGLRFSRDLAGRGGLTDDERAGDRKEGPSNPTGRVHYDLASDSRAIRLAG